MDIPEPLVERFRAEAARRSLQRFCAYMNPSYQSARHTRLICEQLEAVERGEIRKLMILMPPRHSKSLHVSQYFPAWWIGRRPSDQIILTSYSAELIESFSRIARNLVTDRMWPFDTAVSDDATSVSRWATKQGGIVVAVGREGALTGRGAHLMIIDDPLRDREEADSPGLREKLWSWYEAVALTRLQPGGCIVLCETFWNSDDLAGRILASSDAPNWTVLRLPALAESGDPLGRDEGDALWPEWFDQQYLLELRAMLSPREWSALYQQRPVAAEGATFRSEWMGQRYSDVPVVSQVVMAVDSAFKTGVANDYSAIAVWGTTAQQYVLLDLWRGRVEYPELKRAIEDMHDVWHPSGVLIEDTASGQSAIQELKRSTRLPIIATTGRGGKLPMAESVSPLFESGRVTLPKDAPFLTDWIEEHLTFPTGKHDDFVDTTSVALIHLSRQGSIGSIHWGKKPVAMSVGGRPKPNTGSDIFEGHGAIVVRRKESSVA